MDYVMAALEGLGADEYVPGSYDCAIYIKFTTQEFTWMIEYLYDTPDTSLSITESLVFNVTGTLAGHLGNAIYDCYTLPNITSTIFKDHYT